MGDNIHLEKNNKFISKLKDIVLGNFTNEQFGASDLVKQYGMSRSQLHRKLKTTTGQSVSQFIREIRLEESLKLLQNEDITASEVAYKVGFNSPTYFNTCFHEYFGYPPGEAQLQMELTKSNNDSDVPSTSKENTSSKNRRILILLSVITLIVVSLFAYQYYDWEREEEVIPTGEKEKTIAVLPLKNWSGDLELEYISDGMTDAIISKLAGIQAIERVVPFASILQYKDTDKDISTIAEELGVEYILEGNFKLSGSQVQSNLKLIEASSNEHIWTLEYTGTWKSDEIFEMQAAVAENVAENMQAKVTTSEKEEINTMPTDNAEAYRIYLEAENQYNKLSKYGLKNAITLYEKAIAIDSSFVEPYVGLGRTYFLSGLVWGILPEQQAWQQGKAFFENALELDKAKSGNNSYLITLELVAGSFYFEYALRKAEQHYQESLSSKDGLTYYSLGFDYTRKTGRLDHSMKMLDSEIEYYPVGADAYMHKAFIHYMLGEKDTALDLLEIHDPLNQDNYFYLLETSKWYYYMDEIDKSREHLKVLLEHHEDRPPIVYWLSAIHGEIAGESEIVNSSLHSLHEQYENHSSGSPAWFMALYYCHTKDYDKAFEWLQKSYDQREVEMTWFKEEPMLRPLRTDPRYIDLYEQVGFSKISPITPYVD